ncbi:unnamed protein product [Polarella glacialis]|uniref:Right handed beta helix domain-containing protein n=1 Tax=Polarella glacialis TaxID=89957 RepID=A0A813LG06_POLGL|nr:unnamed protein product [Polarella glacialis]
MIAEAQSRFSGLEKGFQVGRRKKFAFPAVAAVAFATVLKDVGRCLCVPLVLPMSPRVRRTCCYCLTGEIPWPSEEYSSFEQACQEAVLRNRRLCLQAGSLAQLGDQSFQLRRNRDRLHICGGDGAEGGSSVIEGSGHSVFNLAGRHCSLFLEGVTLRHTASSAAGDGSDIGAAIFAMSKSRTELCNVSVTSLSGLGLWLVQSAELTAQRSSLLGCGRSGLAMFGHSVAKLELCELATCAVHGACARGDTQLTMRDCRVRDCGRRGVYAYQRSKLLMRGCRVTGTRDAERAGVELAAARPGDGVSGCVEGCVVSQNAGAGIRLRGAVSHQLSDNSCSGNGGKDLLVERGSDNDAWPQAVTSLA